MTKKEKKKKRYYKQESLLKKKCKITTSYSFMEHIYKVPTKILRKRKKNSLSFK